MTDRLDDSAILFLDESPSNHQQNITTTSGHQILDQVQKELQFLPTQGDDYIAGTITTPNSSSTTVDIVPTVTKSLPKDNSHFLTADNDLNGELSSSNNNEPNQQRSKFTIWQFEYYSQYFQINTDLFWQRVIWACFPLSTGAKGTYNERFIQGNPDLYGPFWIAMTLAVTISIGDSLIKFFNWISPPECALINNSTLPVLPQCDHPHLKFTFEHLYTISVVTFTYIFMAPLIFWAFCRWLGCLRLIPFLECFTTYGYSLSIFIPITILSIINIREIQFILFFSGAFLSAANLLVSFSPVVSTDPSESIKISYLILIFIGFAHLFLALFYLYMFL